MAEPLDPGQAARPLWVDLDDRLGEGVDVLACRGRRVVRPPWPATTTRRTDWWMSAFPGLALLLTVVGVNLVADAVNEASNP